MCQLFDPLCTPGKLDVSIKALDEIAGETPLFILESNGHIAHVNSAAFKLAEVTKDTPDPPNSRFIKDEDGNLTGEVQEIGTINKFLMKAKPVTLD